MTPEQEKVLVETVERVLVIIQHIDWQAWHQDQRVRAGMLDHDLCNAFPWLREEPKP